MKTSTLLLITILPIELMTLLLFFLPEKHLITGIMMMALYFGIIMLISGKYIKRGEIYVCRSSKNISKSRRWR